MTCPTFPLPFFPPCSLYLSIPSPLAHSPASRSLPPCPAASPAEPSRCGVERCTVQHAARGLGVAEGTETKSWYPGPPLPAAPVPSAFPPGERAVLFSESPRGAGRRRCAPSQLPSSSSLPGLPLPHSHPELLPEA